MQPNWWNMGMSVSTCHSHLSWPNSALAGPGIKPQSSVCNCKDLVLHQSLLLAVCTVALLKYHSHKVRHSQL